ncbi:MAG: hypothetical protein AAF938_13155 [Myxococcota bacterium]
MAKEDGVRLKGEERRLRLQDEALRFGDQTVGALRYRVGRVRDEIDIDGTTYVLPSGEGGRAQALIRRSRLAEPSAAADGRTLELDDGLREWVGTWASDEALLACLLTSHEVDVPSTIGEGETLRAYFVLSSKRMLLVAVGRFGDVFTEALEGPMAVHAERGRDRIVVGAHEFLTSRTNEGRFHDIASWCAATGDGRVRLALSDALEQGNVARAEQLAGQLSGDGALSVALWLRAGEGAESPPSSAFRAFEAAVEEANEWCARWELDTVARAALVSALRRENPSSRHALELHRALFEGEDEKGHAERVAWADHLFEAGHEDDAAAVLADGLAALGDGSTMDLVPHFDSQETSVAARIALLEATRELFEGARKRDAVLSLARLQPLKAERLLALAAEGDAIGERAQIVAGMLERVEPDGHESPNEVRALEEEELSLLRHPVGRTDEFLGALSTYVANIERPDHSALREFCPKLQDAKRVAVFERAAKRLGVRADVYVSSGDRSRGCVGYEDEDSMFVVLGGEHLDEGAARRLGEAGLAFAFASELAHLRFGHSRVTSSELWKGAFDLGVSGFDVLLGAVPLLGRYRIGDGISKVANAIKDGSAQRMTRRARKLLRLTKDEEAAEETLEATAGELDEADELLAAHRLMQLSADRAGLLLCGHPAPAIHAMLALDTSRAFETFEAEGLLAMTQKRNEDRSLIYEGMTLRICALLSFWLSDEYSTLLKPGSDEQSEATPP